MLLNEKQVERCRLGQGGGGHGGERWGLGLWTHNCHHLGCDLRPGSPSFRVSIFQLSSKEVRLDYV